MSQVKENRVTSKKTVEKKKEEVQNNEKKKNENQTLRLERCIEEKGGNDSKEFSMDMCDMTDTNGNLNAYDNLLGAPCLWKCLSEKYGWYLIKTVNNFEFYFNILTNKRCWQCPQELKESMYQEKKVRNQKKEKEKIQVEREGEKEGEKEGEQSKYELEKDIEIFSDYSSNLGESVSNGNEKILAILHSFKDMLIEKNIQKTDIYEKVLPLIQYDIRFLSVPHVVRKQCFYLLLKKIHEKNQLTKKEKNFVNYPHSMFALIEDLKILLQKIEMDSRRHCNENDIHLLLQDEKEYVGNDTESWKQIRELLIKEYVQKLITEKKRIENGFNSVFRESMFLTNPSKYMYVTRNNNETTERYKMIYIEECVNLFKQKSKKIMSYKKKRKNKEEENETEIENGKVQAYAEEMGKYKNKEKNEWRRSRNQLEKHVYHKSAYSHVNSFSNEKNRMNKKRKILINEKKERERKINNQIEKEIEKRRSYKEKKTEEKNIIESRDAIAIKQRNETKEKATFMKHNKGNIIQSIDTTDISDETGMAKRKRNDDEKEGNDEMVNDMKKEMKKGPNLVVQKKSHEKLEVYRESNSGEYLMQNDQKEEIDINTQKITENKKLEPRDDTVMLYLLFENVDCPVINEVLLRSGNYEEKECFEKVFNIPESITNNERYKKLCLNDNEKFQIYKHFVIGFTTTKLNIFKERINLLPIEYINQSLNDILKKIDRTGTEFAFLNYTYMHNSYTTWKRKRIKIVKEKFQEYLNDFDFSKYDLNASTKNEELIEHMSLERSYQLLKCVRHERDEMINKQIKLFKKKNDNSIAQLSQSEIVTDEKEEEHIEEKKKEEDDIEEQRRKIKERVKWKRKEKKKWKKKGKKKWKNKDIEKWKEFIREKEKWKNKYRGRDKKKRKRQM